MGNLSWNCGILQGGSVLKEDSGAHTIAALQDEIEQKQDFAV